jgi:uncharacterized membrane protein
MPVDNGLRSALMPRPRFWLPRRGASRHAFYSVTKTRTNTSQSAAMRVWAAAGIFFALTTSISWLRWANFQYRTFDLAYYVQAIWQLIHGRVDVSVEHAPLLGNHVEPIVFLFAPIFALIRHPMVFVVVQNAALAVMAPIGYRMARRYFDRFSAAILAIALLLAPASGYIALHEFHPEALAAPMLLLMYYSRLVRRLWLHWICFLGVLACKENMSLLLAAYCLVFLVMERREGPAELGRWFGTPLVVALLWFALCAKVITPAFNAGHIDYLSLYNRLGETGGEILWNTISRPQLMLATLWRALTHGNLIWGLFLPFLGLPLLRPRWLLISAPIAFQHLLSWRSSEWTIYFHYGAPLLPLFWVGSVEALARLQGAGSGSTTEGPAPASPPQDSVFSTSPSLRIPGAIACVLLCACFVAQLWMGPARLVASELRERTAHRANIERKRALLRRIPEQASVTAPLPYLSHLAMREHLYSLHYILKGLTTLGRERYQPPPPPDFVLIDYGDDATFDAAAGYYHPQMRTADGGTVPSSDRLLHDFLTGAGWTVDASGELALLTKTTSPGSRRLAPRPADAGEERDQTIGPGNVLQRMERFAFDSKTNELDIAANWRVDRARQIFPWMNLRVTSGDGVSKSYTKGLCAVEFGDGVVSENWRATVEGLQPGEYTAEAIFVDNADRRWRATHGKADLGQTSLSSPVLLGKFVVR